MSYYIKKGKVYKSGVTAVKTGRRYDTRRKTITRIMAGLLFAILIAAAYFQAAKIKTVDAASSSDSIPAYAFNGAYVTYTLNDYYNRRITFAISEVNVTSQTFKVSWSYIGSWDFKLKDSSEVISYADISPFPNNESNIPFSAASFDDLQILNRGEVPVDMPAGCVVTPSLYVYALGGYYFNTDWLQMPSGINGTGGASVYLDMHSGLTVNEEFDETGALWDIAYGQLSLITTNIPMTTNVRASPSPSGPMFLNQSTVAAISGAAVIVVVVAGLLVYHKKRKRKLT